MLGYVRYDLPNLFVKDLTLYKALYCGLCKGIASSCGQMARVGLSYDVAFLSALLHNLAGQDVKITPQNCFEHAVRKRPIAEADGLTKELGALNVLLCYFKLTDDIADGEGGRGRRLWFKRGYRRAKRDYPGLVSLVEEYMAEQAAAERAHVSSLDMAADPSAKMMRSLSRRFLGEKAGESTDELFYALGKWVYLIDALDDIDKDRKKGNYNPFLAAYPFGTKRELLEAKREDVAFLFDTLFFDLREGLSGCKFHFNRDLIDNVILRGIPLETERVMRGDPPVRMSVKV